MVNKFYSITPVIDTVHDYPCIVVKWDTETMYQNSLKLHPDWATWYWLEASARDNNNFSLDILFDACGDEKELIEANAPDEWYANNKEYSWSFYTTYRTTSTGEHLPQASNYVHLKNPTPTKIAQMQAAMTAAAQEWCLANNWYIDTDKNFTPNQNKLLILRPKTNITLKDGSISTDRRLGRFAQWDERNRNFDARTLLEVDQTVPRTFTWDCYVHLDQGDGPTCVGNSFAHELAAKPKVVTGVDEDYALNIYNIAQTLDEYPGTNYDGTSTLGGVKACVQLGKVGEYHWCLDIEALKLVVSWKKPVSVGTNWYNKMFYPDSNGFVHIGNGIAGGHEYLVKGYNVEGDYFICQNSWGTSWNPIMGGDFKISSADLNRLVFNENGDAVVPTHMTK